LIVVNEHGHEAHAAVRIGGWQLQPGLTGATGLR
jgi:hypothetical protein